MTTSRERLITFDRRLLQDYCLRAHAYRSSCVHAACTSAHLRGHECEPRARRPLGRRAERLVRDRGGAVGIAELDRRALDCTDVEGAGSAL